MNTISCSVKRQEFLKKKFCNIQYITISSAKPYVLIFIQSPYSQCQKEHKVLFLFAQPNIYYFLLYSYYIISYSNQIQTQILEEATLLAIFIDICKHVNVNFFAVLISKWHLFLGLSTLYLVFSKMEGPLNFLSPKW